MTPEELRKQAESLRILADVLDIQADEKTVGSKAPIKLGQLVRYQDDDEAHPGRPYVSCGEWYIEANGATAKARYWTVIL